MTIPATPRRSPVYVVNGVATSYAFPFKVTDPATVVVTVADADDLNAQTLVYGVDFTVTLNADQNADPGGEVTCPGQTIGHRLVITSDTDASQPTSITNLGAFHANVLEGALDRIVILHQQQQEQLDRCVKVGVTSEQDPSAFLHDSIDLAANSAAAAAAAADAANASAGAAALSESNSAASESAADADAAAAAAAAAASAAAADAANASAGAAADSEASATSSASLASAKANDSADSATLAESARVGAVAAADAATLSESNAADSEASAAASASAAANFLGSFRNKLINGLFSINQRNHNNGSATVKANQYTLDRWRVVVSGQSVSWVVSGVGLRITAPVGGFEQVIEGSSIEGGVYTLSWVGTATATVNGTPITNGGQTASLTAGSNVTVRFSGGTVEQAQFELGNVATRFEVRPRGVELLLCQRYYESAPATSTVFSGQVSSGSAYYGVVRYSVTKRVAATITATVGPGVAAFPAVDPTVPSGWPEGFRWQTPACNATTTGYFPIAWTAEAEL